MGGGKRPQRIQTFDSSGPDIRVRGNAHQVLERYLALARDATSQGDRISAENYYQHAEHYFRVINNANQGNGRHRHTPAPNEDALAAADEAEAEVERDGEEPSAGDAADGRTAINV